MADYNINAVTRKVVYTGSAGLGPYSFSFEVLVNTDIAVYFNTTLLTLTTDYSVTINANGTGSVTIVTGTGVPTTPDGDDTITIVGARDIERTTDFSVGGDLSAAALNEQLDAEIIFIQQIDERVDRAIKAAVTDPTTINMELPVIATRANKLLAFDADGDVTVSTETVSQIEGAATSATAADASATAAAASAALAAEWATKTTGQVASTDYAAKAWAIGGTGVTDTATAGAAKEWATAAEDDLVDGSEYSAKHYSAKSATSATNAAASETAALAAAQGWAAVTSVTAATTNIEITDGRTYYLLDATSNTVDINLPAIGTDEGVTYAFEVVNVDNAITIVRDGTDYINGANGDYSGLTAVGDVIYFTSDDSTPDNWIATLVTRVNADESTLTLTGRTMSILDNGVTPAKVSGSVNAQTGTTYTLVIGDAFKTVTMSNVSANTLTIPPNSSVAFAVGDRIDIVMLAAGVTSVVGGSGVTVNGVSTGTGAIAAQYGAVSCLKIATDTWLLMGNHGGVA